MHSRTQPDGTARVYAGRMRVSMTGVQQFPTDVKETPAMYAGTLILIRTFDNHRNPPYFPLAITIH